MSNNCQVQWLRCTRAY